MLTPVHTHAQVHAHTPPTSHAPCAPHTHTLSLRLPFPVHEPARLHWPGHHIRVSPCGLRLPCPQLCAWEGPWLRTRRLRAALGHLLCSQCRKSDPHEIGAREALGQPGRGRSGPSTVRGYHGGQPEGALYGSGDDWELEVEAKGQILGARRTIQASCVSAKSPEPLCPR